MTKDEFILIIGQAAQRQMQKHNILASLILAQACLESNYGKSGLAVQGKNLFGVKGRGTAGSITMQTKEFVNGQWITVNAAFAKYHTWDDSLEAHSQLFLNGVSWDRNKYKSIIGERDYKTACQKVQAAGYATDPTYADKLIKVIEDNKLFAWDKGVNPVSEQQFPLSTEDANKIIALLGAGWHICKDKASQDEFKRLANELRKASGQQTV